MRLASVSGPIEIGRNNGLPVPDTSASSLVRTVDLIAQYANDPGCQLQTTNDGDAYFCATGPQQGDWAAIDSERVLEAKARYVRDQGLGGVMSWSVAQDEGGHLLEALARGLD